MPKIQDNIAVNAAGGAQVSLSATLWARKVTIMEDPVNGAAAGLAYQLGSENFAVTHQLQAGEVLTLGDTIAHGAGHGPIIGAPAQANLGTAATVYAKLISLGAATKARMTETE